MSTPPPFQSSSPSNPSPVPDSPFTHALAIEQYYQLQKAEEDLDIQFEKLASVKSSYFAALKIHRLSVEQNRLNFFKNHPDAPESTLIAFREALTENHIVDSLSIERDDQERKCVIAMKSLEADKTFFKEHNSTFIPPLDPQHPIYVPCYPFTPITFALQLQQFLATCTTAELLSEIETSDRLPKYKLVPVVKQVSRDLIARGRTILRDRMTPSSARPPHCLCYDTVVVGEKITEGKLSYEDRFDWDRVEVWVYVSQGKENEMRRGEDALQSKDGSEQPPKGSWSKRRSQTVVYEQDQGEMLKAMKYEPVYLELTSELAWLEREKRVRREKEERVRKLNEELLSEGVENWNTRRLERQRARELDRPIPHSRGYHS